MYIYIYMFLFHNMSRLEVIDIPTEFILRVHSYLRVYSHDSLAHSWFSYINNVFFLTPAAWGLLKTNLWQHTTPLGLGACVFCCFPEVLLPYQQLERYRFSFPRCLPMISTLMRPFPWKKPPVQRRTACSCSKMRRMPQLQSWSVPAAYELTHGGAFS